MVSLGNGFEARVIATFEGGDYISRRDFGLELPERLRARDIENLLFSRGDFWPAIEQYGVLFAKTSLLNFDFRQRTKAVLETSSWHVTMNERRGVNNLPHADGHDFALLGTESRGPTAYMPRENAILAYLNRMENFKAKYPHLVNEIEEFQLQLSVCYHTKCLYREDAGFDPLKTLVVEFILKISRDPKVGDEDIFCLEKNLDEGVGVNQIVRPWEEGDLAFISRRTFHRRVCASVSDVSDMNSPLYIFHRELGRESLRYIAQHI